MRAILLAAAGLLGGAAFWRSRQRKKAGELTEAPSDPAAELRARLAESRAGPPEPAPASEEPAAGPEPEVATSSLDLDSRRKSVHERARASMDELG